MRTLAACLFVLTPFLSTAQQAANRPTLVAGIPVNYNEDSVGNYVLPDLLRCADGTAVTTAKIWSSKRRPELLKMVEETQFGKSPGRPKNLSFRVQEQRQDALGGKAVRKQVSIYLTGDTSVHVLHLLLYTPAKASSRVPVLLNISFSAYNQIIDDPGLMIGQIWNKEGQKVKADQPTSFGKLDVAQFIDAGLGFATFYYGDVEPDFKDGIKQGIRGKYLQEGAFNTGSDEWGAIAAWSWGMSRVLDYLETDKHVDAKRVAVQGASRLGKTVLWAGIRDTRFKAVIASISGEGGAAIARRNYGETAAHITDPSRYLYQFAPQYHSYARKLNELPFDAHALVALMAPRPLLLQTGSTDYWSDPKGEYLSAVAAAPVYKLFGKTGPVSKEMPAANDQSLVMNDLGYYMHEGGHTVLPADWKIFIEYLKRYL